MGIVHDMASIAAECAKTPGRVSVWSTSLGRYVCSEDPAFQFASVENSRTPLTSAFKLVFLTAAGGTLLFVIICVTTTIIAGESPPPLLEKTVTSLFDLAKIGFGAIVGLLGGQALRA